ncbi:AbrB/MazE/SpoVT family DNA-binding domain-containing protein [Thiocapsa sp.]|uniref:AbrB/MazE/SpoVT family DNA-binding domain-containing protein n=1 Tax=Thiocapsa sp. TaxID=2024551 RepID=UPI003593D654
MRTTLRKIGNSRGVLIPAALLAKCGIRDEIELRLEGSRIVIEPVSRARAGCFDGYQPENDPDARDGLAPDSDWTSPD